MGGTPSKRVEFVVFAPTFYDEYLFTTCMLSSIKTKDVMTVTETVSHRHRHFRFPAVAIFIHPLDTPRTTFLSWAVGPLDLH